MCQPSFDLVVTITLEFIEEYMECSYVTDLLIIASQPRLNTCYKVYMCFEMQ
jgi:hypothetical protein